MSDVVEFKRPEKPVGPEKPPKSPFYYDEHILKWCVEWRAARAQQEKNWAEYQLESMWGTLDDGNINVDLKPLDRIKELEGLLADDEVCRPHTILAARELLHMAVTILAYEDPQGTLAEGPVLDIVRNVVKSLEYCKAEMRIGPKREQQDD